MPPGAEHRSSTRSPGGGAEHRRDALRGARLRHVHALLPQRVAVGVERARRPRRRPATPAPPPLRRPPRRPPRASSAAGWPAAPARAARWPGAISALAVAGPNASRHSVASQPGIEWRTASSSIASRIARPSRVARRSTALTRPEPRERLASSTVSSTAAWSGIPSRKRICTSPTCSAARTGGSSLLPPSVSSPMTWSSVRRRWIAPNAICRASARSRGSSCAASAWKAWSANAPCSQTRRTTRKAARRAGEGTRRM